MLVVSPPVRPSRSLPTRLARPRRAPSVVRRRATRWAVAAWQADVSAPIRRVQDYVAVRVGEVRTLDELADVAGLSRYHFARRFRDEVGMPPWAYVRKTRAERARRLLEDGAPPAEVAHETGYADQPHLTRDLRARFGRTPAQIRRPLDEAGGENRKDVQDLEPADG